MSEAHTPATWKLQFLSDVTTAAGLLESGKQCKGLAKRIGKYACRMRVSLYDQPASEINAELLAALKYARRNVKASECDIAFIDAAITKATKPVSAGVE